MINKRNLVCSAIFSFLFSTSLVVGSKIDISQYKPFQLEFTNIFTLAGVSLVVCIICYILIYSVNKNEKIIINKKIPLYYYFIFSSIIFACWIPYFLSHIPGVLSPDSFSSVQIALGQTHNITNWIPLLFTQFVSLFLHIGLFFTNSLQNAIIFVSLAQMILFSAILGYIVYYFAKHGSNKIILIFTIGFYSLCPIISFYSFTIWKDILFSAVLLLFTLFICELIDNIKNHENTFLQNKLWASFFIITSFLVIFLRNNGIFICFITFAVLAVIFKKYWKKLIPVFSSVLVISVLIQGPLYSAIGIRPSPFSESAGILLGQISRVAAENGDMSNNDKEELEKVLPISNFKKDYLPRNVDPIKGDPKFNMGYLDNHKFDFIKTWVSVGIKNPSAYIVAQLSQTKFLWYPFELGRIGGGSVTDNDYSIKGYDVINFSSITNFVYSNFRLGGGSTLIFSSGFLIFYIIFLIIFFIFKSKKLSIIPLIPLLSAWGTIFIATPADDFRYIFALFLAIPLYIFFAFYSESKQNK
ncbi:MAG: DUF6020 family protein [Bifidobacteriaceae bacterium]|jgi:hypothetical protein|nr:DUF6020 family protein [Bifidobacteriaceae bacterium]